MKKLCTFLVLLLVILVNGQENNDWKIGGQIQIRSEMDGRDFSNKTYPPIFTTMRSRASVEKSVGDNFNFMFQVQDSRIWGQTGSPTAYTDNIDLHQAYITLKDLFDIPFKLQAGRFEVKYGTERFFGPSNWSLMGRRFDGIRLSFGSETKIDVFVLTVADTSAFIKNIVSRNAVPSVYRYPSASDHGHNTFGTWINGKLNPENSYDLFGYYELNRNSTNGKDDDLNRMTVGLNHAGKYGNVSTVVEGAYQFGKLAGMDISAYLVSAQANFSFNSFKVGGGADLISGTELTEKSKNYSFSTSYGTSHKYLGYMDYFFKSQSSIKGIGLNDFYLLTEYAPKESKWNAALNIHHFMSNKKGADDYNVFGQEFDLTVKYLFTKGVTLSWGGSIFLPGDLMKTFFKVGSTERSDPAFWSYLMASVNI